MTKLFLKGFIIFLSLTIASCKMGGDSKKIRIVDLQGKSHALKTRVPELNAPILQSQGKLQQQENMFENSTASSSYNNQNNDNFSYQQPTEVNEAPLVEQNKYATADYQAASSELAMQNAQLQGTVNTPQSPNTQYANVAAGKVAEEEIKEIDITDSTKSKKSFGKASVLAKHKVAAKRSNKKVAVPSSQESYSSDLSGIFVQTGAFSTLGNAEKSALKMQKFSKTQIEESEVQGKKFYRVLLGPFSNKTKAKQMVSKIKGTGHDAIIVRKK
jgi:cell division protein FtsN